MDISEMEEKIERKKKAVNPDLVKGFLMMYILFICMFVIIIGCKLANVIISIIYKSENVLFFILSIISLVSYCFFHFIFYLAFHNDKLKNKIMLAISLAFCLIIDGVIYYLYIYQEIQLIAFIILNIISEIIFSPLCLISFCNLFG